MKPEPTKEGISCAYEYVMPSHEWALSRLNTVETRIRSLLAFAATLTLAGPAIGRMVVPGIPGDHPALITALFLFLAVVGIGLYTNVAGELQLPGLSNLADDKFTTLDSTSFKMHMLAYAGDAFKANTRLVNCNAHWAIAMTVLLAVEVLAFVVWILLA